MPWSAASSGILGDQVADVVQQRRHDLRVAGPPRLGVIGRLQRVLQLRDRLAHVGRVPLGGEQFADFVDDVFIVSRSRSHAGKTMRRSSSWPRPRPASARNVPCQPQLTDKSGHGIAGSHGTKIADAVDNSTGGAAPLLAAQVERNRAGQIGIGPQHQKTDQAHQPDRRQRCRRRNPICARQRQDHGRQQRADEITIARPPCPSLSPSQPATNTDAPPESGNSALCVAASASDEPSASAK